MALLSNLSTFLTSQAEKKGIAFARFYSHFANGSALKDFPLKLLTHAACLFCLLFTSLSHAALLNIDPATVEAEAWTILDAQSGQTIAEYNSHAQRAPASMTKMMVAYIALKEIQAGHLKKEEILTATPVVNLVQWDESQMYLKPGEQISIDQLLAGLIVMSANDAAVSLAERISGDVPSFVARMNKEAQALGMHDTHFQNPPGVTMPEHYSSAHDMALLGRAVAMQTPDYLHYSIMPSFSYNQRFHRATNLVLKVDPTVDGLKTGFTKAAGYNLALTAHRPTGDEYAPERRLIVVVMGTKSGIKRAEVAHKLMNLAYSFTRNEVIIKPKQLLAELPVVKSTLKMFKVETQQPSIVSTSLYNKPQAIDLDGYDASTNEITLNLGNGVSQIVAPLTQTATKLEVKLKHEALTAPLSEVMQLATVEVYQDNVLLNRIDIEENVTIVEASVFERFCMWLKNLLPFVSSSEQKLKTYPVA